MTEKRLKDIETLVDESATPSARYLFKELIDEVRRLETIVARLELESARILAITQENQDAALKEGK
jgi:hypothetical protein